MTKNLIALILVFFAPALVSATDTDDAFRNLADEYISDLTNFSPVSATLIGDHRADHKIDRVDAAARADRRELLMDYLAALEVLDFDELSRANQVDAEILRNQLESSLWSLDELQEWAWNPLYYIRISGNAIYGLVARDFAPVQTRLRSATARLRQIPRLLEQSRQQIEPARVPPVHAQTAVKQNRGLISIIDNMIVPEMDVLSEDEQEQLNAAIELAKNAVSDHQLWLEEELAPQAAGDFRIGAKLYDQKLAFALNSPLGREEIVARAKQEFENVRNQMYTVSKKVYLERNPYTKFPEEPDDAYKQAIIRAALEQAYQKLPPADGIVAVAKQQMQQATDFVIEKNLVTMPEEPVEVIVMPEFRRGVSIAYLDAPGPLDRELATFYAVSPIPADWSEEQILSFLREYNLYSMQDLTIHEGVPGHYLQLALSNRYPSTLRAVLGSGPFIEGWAVYAEQFMVEEGYLDYDPLMRLISLKWYLRGITNAMIDSAIHVENMSRDEAMELMVEGGFQEEREAALKWVRAQLTSAQLSTYFVGYQEHIEMRAAVEAAWGDDFSLRKYHDQALSYGSPPVKYVRALILDEEIPRQGD